MKIKNTDSLTLAEIKSEVSNGAKFVVFQYTVSILIMTFKRPTDVYFIRSNESHWGKSLPYTLLSLILGWWGFPWGLIYTPMAIFTNLTGGKDVTQEIMDTFGVSIDPQLVDAHVLDA
jgi:hypothetical protein